MPIGASLWVDELHTAWTVSGGLDEVAARAWIGNQSPLYFWGLWQWTSACGLSESMLRLPSVLAGAALIPLTYLFVARATGSRMAALLGAVVAALNPLGFEFSIEARPYAWVQLLALGHVLLLAELLRRRRPAAQDAKKTEATAAGGLAPLWLLRAGWIVCGVLLFHLHYTAALLLPAEAAAFVLVRMFDRRGVYGWTACAIDLALTAVGWLPAAGHLVEVGGRRDNWAMFVDHAPLWDSPLWFPWTHVVAWSAALLAATAAFRWLRGRRPLVRPVSLSTVLLVACWAAAPAIVAWTLNQTDIARLFFLRYLVVSIPAPAAAVGLFCGASVGWARWLQLALLTPLAFVAAGLTLAGLQSGRLPVQPPNEDWRGAVQYILDRQRSDTSPVFVDAGLIEASQLPADDGALQRYCLSVVTGIYRLDQPGRPLVALSLEGRPSPSATPRSSELLTTGEAWVLVRGRRREAESARAGVAAALVEAGAPGDRIEVDTRRFPGVTVLRISW